MNVAAADRKEWMLPLHAANALGTSTSTLKRIAPRLGIRCREIPGRTGKLFNRADVESAVARLEAAEAGQVAAAQGEVIEESSGRNGRPGKSNGTAQTR